jgi:hypothetical protein
VYDHVMVYARTYIHTHTQIQVSKALHTCIHTYIQVKVSKDLRESEASQVIEVVQRQTVDVGLSYKVIHVCVCVHTYIHNIYIYIYAQTYMHIRL